jgi:hypothetical protein
MIAYSIEMRGKESSFLYGINYSLNFYLPLPFLPLPGGGVRRGWK